MRFPAIRCAVAVTALVISVICGALTVPRLCAQEDNAPREFDKFLEGLESPSAASRLERRPTAGEDLGRSKPSNPLVDLAERMQNVGRRLAGQDTSPATQDLQVAIAGDLAELIERLESQAEQQKAAQRSASGPSNQAGTAAESDPAADTTAAEEESHETLIESMWGKLPQRLRQQIQSPLQEEFLPSYRRVIEDYYKRIAAQPKRP